MKKPRIVESTLEFPYSRTLGPVVGAFLAGLQGAPDPRHPHRATARCSSRRSSTTRTPATTLERAGRGRAAGNRRARGRGSTSPRRSIRSTDPFAFALVTPDGADTAMVHAVDAGSIDKMSTGHARAAALARRSAQHDRRPRVLGARMTDVSTPKENLVMESPRVAHVLRGAHADPRAVRRRADRRPHRRPQVPAVRAGVRARQGLLPDLRGRRPTDDDEVEVSDHGTVTGFTIITPVAYYGQTETEPFVYASVLLDGVVGQPRRPGHRRRRRTTSCIRACACARCGSRRTSAVPRACRTAVGASVGVGDRRVRVDRRARHADRSVYEEHIF